MAEAHTNAKENATPLRKPLHALGSGPSTPDQAFQHALMHMHHRYQGCKEDMHAIKCNKMSDLLSPTRKNAQMPHAPH